MTDRERITRGESRAVRAKLQDHAPHRVRNGEAPRRSWQGCPNTCILRWEGRGSPVLLLASTPPSSVLAGRKAAGPRAAAALAGCSVRAWHTRLGSCSSQRGWSSCGAGGPRSQPRPGLAPERTDSTFQPVDSCPWKSFCCEPEMRSADGKCPGFGFPLR